MQNRPRFACSILLLAFVLPATRASARTADDLPPLEIARDCGVGDRLSLVRGRTDDATADRYELFSRTAAGDPATWRAGVSVDGSPARTFPDDSLADRQFQVALKSEGGAVRDWGAWYAPACLQGSDTGATTPSAGTDALAALELRRDCTVSDGARLEWGALEGATEYRLFGLREGAGEWLATVDGSREDLTLPEGLPDGIAQVQVDARDADGNDVYGDYASIVCETSGTGGDGEGGENELDPRPDPAPDAIVRSPAFLDEGGWSQHPWGHEFSSPSDLDRWYAPDRLGERDPDDRHVGKARADGNGGLVDNAAAFAEVASIDTDPRLGDASADDGVLRMRSFWDAERGEARMPYLISFAAQDTLDAAGNRISYEPGIVRPCLAEDGVTLREPCDLIIDPRQRDHYIETRVNFEGAQEAFRAWWAMWLFAPSDNYDGDVDTGMEVDVLEYVPHVTEDGFNAALFRGTDGTSASKRAAPERPDGFDCDDERADVPGGYVCDGYTANQPDTDAYLRMRNADYDACRAAGTCPAIRLNEGFHTVGIHYTADSYAMYIDGYLFWEVVGRDWVTSEPELGIQLTWEKDEGNVIDDADGDGIPNYLEDGLGGATPDSVWRASRTCSSTTS